MSGSKRNFVRGVDVPVPVTGAGGLPLASESLPAQNPAPRIPAPYGLAVADSGYERSGPSPSAYIQVSWFPGAGTPSSATYELQYSTASNFSVTPVLKAVTGPPGEHRGLRPGTTYYFRARAVVGGIPGPWSASLAASVAAADDTPPDPPTGLAAVWDSRTGHVVISCTPPAGENVASVQIRIYTASGGTLLRTATAPGGLYTWLLQQQRQDRGGSLPLPASASAYIIANAVSWAGNLSSDVTLSISRPALSAPSGLAHGWQSDDGTAGANLRATWTRADDVAYYALSIDGVTAGRDRILAGGYDYPLALNAAEHSGTPDPVLSLSLVAYDALGQASTAATATATNAAPPATTISAFGAFDKVGLTIGASAAQDIKDYRVRVYLASVLVDTFYTTDTTPVYVAGDGDGDYTFDVAPRDAFGQLGTASAQTAAQSLTDPGQFVEDLRSGVVYRDSVATDPATLAGLKDGDTATNVVTYTSSTPWRWTEAIRAFVDRHRKANLATSASASFYYGVSVDGVTWSWYAGGTATGGVWSPVAQASEAAAQAAATTLAAGVWLIVLPANVEARYFRLGHRNTSASYALRELYPRGLIEVDDLRIETLAGITANLGTVVAGEMTGVTITGGTVQTAASGARVELTSAGLKTYNAAGEVVIEATTATDGALKAGVGVVTLDRDGIRVAAATTATPEIERGYNFVSSLATPPDYYGVYGFNFFDRNALLIGIDGTDASPPSLVNIIAAGMDDGGVRSVVSISASTPTDSAGIVLEPEVNISLTGAGVDIATAVSSTVRSAGSLWVAGSATVGYSNGGLNVGSGITGAAAGQIRISGGLSVGGDLNTSSGQIRTYLEDSSSTSRPNTILLDHNSTVTPAAGFGHDILLRGESTTTADRSMAIISTRWAVATDASRRAEMVFSLFDATTSRTPLHISTSGSAPTIGFLGASPAARQTVTGSRGGNAALASLLTALATLGLITDSSS